MSIAAPPCCPEKVFFRSSIRDAWRACALRDFPGTSERPAADFVGSHSRCSGRKRALLAGMALLLLVGRLGAASDEQFVREVLKANCVRCHGEKKAKADVTLHALSIGRMQANEVLTWKKVYEELENGTMPPEDEEQPTAADRQRLMTWIRTSLHAAGEYVDPFKRLRPSRGNWVDHDALFQSKPGSEASSADRVWRVTDAAYLQFMHRVIRDFRIDLNPRMIIPPWRLEASREFSDYSISHRIGEAEITIHQRNCERIASKVVTISKRNPRVPINPVLLAGKSATRAQVEAIVKPLGEKLLDRKLEAAELARYSEFLLDALQAHEPEQALGQFIIAALSHPQVLYRVEPAAGESRRMLPPEHLARALALTLTDREPDSVLRKAAGGGALQTREDVRREVSRILNDPQIEKPRIIGFFREYFGYTSADEVFKCQSTLRLMGVPNKQDYQPQNYVADTDRLVMSVLAADRQVLRELLTTRRTHVLSNRLPASSYLPDRTAALRKEAAGKFGTEPGHQLAFTTYGATISAEDWLAHRTVDMPADQRMGILTHPSWLIAFSTNFENHAIRRGRWIFEKLLGGRISEAPVTVNAALPDEPHNTLRERMRVVRESHCWKCHQRMDPLGLPFEQFDHIGRFRTAEQVVDRDATERLEKDPRSRGKGPVMTTVPANISGGIENSGDPAVNGPVNGALELIRKLAHSERVEQVFVRHVFRYFMGRNETLADGPTLVAAHRAYQANDGSMKALLLSLQTSDTFLYRAKSPGGEAAAKP